MLPLDLKIKMLHLRETIGQCQGGNNDRMMGLTKAKLKGRTKRKKNMQHFHNFKPNEVKPPYYNKGAQKKEH